MIDKITAVTLKKIKKIFSSLHNNLQHKTKPKKTHRKCNISQPPQLTTTASDKPAKTEKNKRKEAVGGDKLNNNTQFMTQTKVTRQQQIKEKQTIVIKKIK